MYDWIKLDLFGPEAHVSGGAGRHDRFGDLHLLLSVLEEYDDSSFTTPNPYAELFERLTAVVGKEHVALNRWRAELNAKIERRPT